MKKLISNVLFGRDARVNGLIALIVVGLVALGCTCGKDFNLSNLTGNTNTTTNTRNADAVSTDDDAPSGDVASDAAVESLVKETTAEFAEAVDSGDFSKIHANSSADFQNTYTVDEMAKAFKLYTDSRSVVVPILNKVSSADAEFSRPPTITTERGQKILVAKGSFPTEPRAVQFDYEYVLRDGDWKMLKLVVKIP